MRRSVFLPARSLTWARGRPAGGSWFRPRVWVGLAWPTPSDQIDSAMPEKRILRASVFHATERSGGEGIVANSPLTKQKSPGLPAGRAEGFPGTGRTLPSRHFSLLAGMGHHKVSSRLGPDGFITCQSFGAFFNSKYLFQSLPRRLTRRVAGGCWGTAAFGRSAAAHSFTGK